jgi:organic hydroperoxide reductase OsmC/OhrA
MQVRATLSNSVSEHTLVTSSENDDHPLPIGAKTDGRGSAVNGAELLCAAVATCFCNDLFREAGTFDIEVIDVTVRARAEFAGPGDPARHIGYAVEVTAVGEETAIRDLIRHTDAVAEIHNTLRLGLPVLLEDVQVRGVGNPA